MINGLDIFHRKVSKGSGLKIVENRSGNGLKLVKGKNTKSNKRNQIGKGLKILK